MAQMRYVAPVVTKMQRSICSVKWQKINAIHIENKTIVGNQARTEMDTRADTSCAGINFWLHELTGQTCTVAPFSATYEPILDVPIATSLTAYTDRYGRTWILVFNKVLWFGSSMDHLLVNPNQIRMTGTPVSDDPFYSTRAIRIKHEDVFIPFRTDGTAIYFDTLVPTKEERAECSWLIMTGDTEWDPISVRLQVIQTNEEEEFRAISEIAQAKKPPLLTQKTDIHLSRILYWLVEQTMTERLIVLVNIKGVNKVKPREEQKPLLPNHYSIRVSEIASKTRHSVHSPEEVSRKFNI